MKSPVETLTLTLATINAASEQSEPAIRSCTGGSACDRTTTIVLVDASNSALDAAFMAFDTATQIFTVTPTVSSQIGTYTMELT